MTSSPVVPWTNDDDLVVVVPRPVVVESTRGDAKRASNSIEWIQEQSDFKYVLCHACTVQTPEPVCAVPTNMGNEASFYIAFIVQNWDRLPRTVAFTHGHRHVQGKKSQQMLDRLRQARDRGLLTEDAFFWFGTGRTTRDLPNCTGLRQGWWNEVWLPFDEIESARCNSSKRVTFQIGSHFVAGRERIRRRPKRLYQELLLWATGQKWYHGSEDWVNGKGNSYSPGQQVSAGFQIEGKWHILMSMPGDTDDSTWKRIFPWSKHE